MELGSKIKNLRLRAGMTQEMLAEELGVSFQTISKWENGVCAPDIMMLPKLSVYFGVTIDELFDLTTDQKLHRIENMLDMESELPHGTFVETVEYLQDLLEKDYDRARIYDFLAHVYHHRVMSDCDKVDKYAKKSMQLRPEIKDCQWLLQKAAGAVVCDWNARNHHRIISFYKELIKENPTIPRNYLDLMDNLLEDNRTKEAAEYLKQYKKLENHAKMQVPIYEGRIALAEHNVALADEKFAELEHRFPNTAITAFELANYYVDKCEYERAIRYYEKSFELDKQEQKRPVYTDALWAIEMIYEIQGKYEEAVQTCDRLLEHLDVEFGFTEGEPVREVTETKQRLLELMRKGERIEARKNL